MRVTGNIYADIALFLYAIVLPGIAMARVFLREAETLLAVTLGAAIGIFTLPLLAFSIAVMARTHISAALILTQGTVVLAVAGGILWKRKRMNQAATTGS